MTRGNEVVRARHIAVRSLLAYTQDKQRSVPLVAIEVRLNGAVPDVTYHVASGSLTQGGYIFFIGDLESEATRPKMAL